MSELKAIRLPKAATTYNVGMDHIVEELKKSGFTIENNPNTKLTVEMVAVLEKAFNKDKAIRDAVESTKVVEKPKKETVELKEEIPAAPKKTEEKEVLIKSNLVKEAPAKEKEPAREKETVKETAKEKAAEPKVEAPAEENTESPTHETEFQRLEGPKILGKVDLNKPKKTVKKKEEPPVVQEEPKVQTPEPPKKVEPKRITLDKIEKQEENPDNIIQRQKVVVEGPKIMGKIELKPEVKPGDNRTKREDGQKRVRKRIEKPKPTRLDGQNNQQNRQGGGFNRPGDNRGNNRGGDNRNHPPKRNADGTIEISEKEIEDKIKATMSKIQSMTSKNDRSKLRRGKREAFQEKLAAEQQDRANSKLQVTEFISVSELASLMNIPPVQIISTCMQLGVIVSINQRLDAEIIELICNDKGFEVEFISAQDQTSFTEEEPDTPEQLRPRAPIVTIMGHVDHGKTSLLDFIRKANVVAGEAGGITQHIGAYEVQTQSGRAITFLDTPGHEAFTAMRARGAKVTDVAVIVIAADDAVMPQTKEAINHAQSAGVPMIFAINKVDKDGANPDRIREQLASMNLLVEEWGGKYQSQEISAKKGLNIDALLDKILIEADLLELKANPDKNANGSVIEATLDKGRGYTTTLLVQAGTMEIGDIIVAGPHMGRIKAMFDHKGAKVKSAGPSTPVQVLGMNGAPQAGEKFRVFDNEQDAKELATKRAQLEREQGIRTKKHITLDEIGRRLALGNFKELNLIIKGDVDGSVEALSDSLLKLSTEEIQVRIIHKGVGQISESDVLLATASDAIVIGFNVRPSQNAKKIADTENIEIKLYSIIYNAIADVKSAMEGLMEPKIEEKVIGNIDVKEVFNITKVGTIAGCFVREGKIFRNSKIRLIRDGIVMHTGALTALKRFKDDVKEVTSGMDCGIQIKDYQNIVVGDVIEVFEETEVARKL
ncbi:MAG: translation initiation factor IF-2 [Chitinophagales bacterium]